MERDLSLLPIAQQEYCCSCEHTSQNTPWLLLSLSILFPAPTNNLCWSMTHKPQELSCLYTHFSRSSAILLAVYSLCVHNVFMCHVSTHRRCDVLLRLTEFSGVVPSCSTLSLYAVFVEVSRIPPEDSHIPLFIATVYSRSCVRTLVNRFRVHFQWQDHNGLKADFSHYVEGNQIYMNSFFSSSFFLLNQSKA